jgi:hypothetical protein
MTVACYGTAKAVPFLKTGLLHLQIRQSPQSTTGNQGISGTRVPYFAAKVVIFFLGRPPRRPFAFAAEVLAVLVEVPPAAPSLLAIHFLEPKNPSRSAGR